MPALANGLGLSRTRFRSGAPSSLPEIFTVDFTSLDGYQLSRGDGESSAPGAYFTFNTGPLNVLMAVWFFGSGYEYDPGVGIGIQTNINQIDLAPAITTKTAAAINSAVGDTCTAVAVGAILTVTQDATGPRTNAADGDGFYGGRITVTQQGS